MPHGAPRDPQEPLELPGASGAHRLLICSTRGTQEPETKQEPEPEPEPGPGMEPEPEPEQE